MNLLINSINKNKYSETFIRNHIKNLPFNNFYLHGGYLPIIYNDQKLIKSHVIQQIPFWTHYFERSRVVKSIIEFIEVNDIQAVLSEYGPCGAEMEEICKRVGIPLFVFFHGFDAYRHNIVSRYKSNYQKLFNYARTIFVASKEMAQRLRFLGAPTNKIVHTACGADVEFFKPSTLERKPQFLFIGRLVPNKNPLKVIEAFNLAVVECSNINLRIIGEGLMKNRCITLIRKLKITNKVELIGPLSAEEILEEMQRSIALILPSITLKNGEKEGTPTTIIEAGATGLPVVATNHGGIPDVVEHGQNGYLIDENDPPEKIAKLMIKLRNDNDLVNKLGAFARKKVIENFSLKEHIDTITEAIRNSIK